jgi:hypothetical protein
MLARSQSAMPGYLRRHQSCARGPGQWLREDIARLNSNEIPIWDGSAALRSRYATEAEVALYRAAAQNVDQSAGDLVLAYLVELDGVATG